MSHCKPRAYASATWILASTGVSALQGARLAALGREPQWEGPSVRAALPAFRGVFLRPRDSADRSKDARSLGMQCFAGKRPEAPIERRRSRTEHERL